MRGTPIPSEEQADRAPRARRGLSRATLALLGLIVVAAASLVLVASGGAALIVVVDDNGPDDVPGQKDLSFMAVDYGLPGATSIRVQWSWDDTATSGANTRDACALFDSDGDGNANFAFCVTVNSNNTFTSQVLRCQNNSPSRCGGGIPVAGATSSTTVTTPYPDPFAGRADHTQCNGPNCLTADTLSDATIVLADVGGAGTRLVNVCSYPSGPGSDPADCVVTQGAGFLSIVKVANPSDGTPFVFNASSASTEGPATWTINGAGSQLLLPYLPTTTLSLNEVVPPTWQLDARSCVIRDAAGTVTGTPSATGVQNLTIKAGLETVCTFTDSPKPGTLTLVKVVDNLGQSGPGYKGPADFPLTINGTATTTGTPVSVPPGTYTIAEVSQPGYSVGAWSCTNGNNGAAGSVSATVTVGAAQNVTCTMTNTLVPAPALSVLKSVVSSGPYSAVGDVIAYAITVTNTGNVTLNGVTVADPGAGVRLGGIRTRAQIGDCSPAIPATLAPGASIQCVATHVVTQADIDAGTYSNTAVADSNETPPSSSTATVPIVQKPSISVTKTVTSTGPYTAVGQPINFAITITNTGNQTLTGVTLTDAAAVLGACAPVPLATLGPLAPGASVVCQATHAVTQADIDAGTYTNVATGDSDQTPPADGTVPVPITQSPRIALAKSAAEMSFSAVGNLLHYTLTATNTGNIALTNVTIADPTIGTLVCTQPVTLAPTASLTCTGTHTVTQADLDAGEVDNVATTTGTPPSGLPVTATAVASVPSSQAPHISLTKTATETSFDHAGQVLHYTLVAKNDGNVTLTSVTIVDPKLGTLTCTQPVTLAPGDSLICTGSYAATQPELDAGEVDNLATVTAKQPSGQNLSRDANARVPGVRAPAMKVTKTVTSVGPYEAVGDVISYAITVTNTGNVTLTGVTVSDPGTGVVVQSCTPALAATLAPGASVVCVATHMVTQADIEAGTYSNTATADSDQTPPGSASATVPITQDPLLDVTKTVTSSGPYDSVGDVVTYSITSTNAGNQILTGVTITDPGVGVVLGTCTPAIPTTLVPGASVVCSATHSLTQADIDAGSYTNVAIADSDQSDPAADDATVQITQNPALALAKTVTSTGPYDSVGQVITYAITLTNTGNQTLTNVRVTDGGVGAVLGPSCLTRLVRILAPGESFTCDASHTVTQADIDAGEYTNVAVGDSDQTDPAADDATVPITQNPLLQVVKTETSVRPYSAVGDIVSYSITATNIGNQTLTGVTITDPGVGAVLGTCTPAIPTTLAPGASVACVATHAVTQADIDAGEYTNTATANSVQAGPESDAETVPTLQSPSLQVVKSVTSTGPYAAVGDLVRYSIKVSNTGNQTLTGVTVTDPGAGVVLDPCPPATVAPGGSLVCTATHAVTQADIDAGTFTNTATATSNEVGPASADATVPIAQSAHITLTKSATEANFDAVGDVLHYTLVATNDGTVTLSNVSIADPKLGALTCTQPVTLAPTASLTCTGSYTIVQADLDAGHVDNTATVTGTPPIGPNVTDTADESVPSSTAPHITLTKSATESSFDAVGDVLHYTLVATNDGNVTLNTVSIVDPTLGALTCTQPVTLAPTASLTCTGTYTVVQGDIDAGRVDNTATVTGTPATGPPNVTDTAHESVPSLMAPHITLTKSATETSFDAVGNVLHYTLVATNDGNVTLSNVSIVDPKLGALTCTQPVSLAPTASLTCTGSYTVGQSDIDGGQVDNTAAVTGTPPIGANVTDTADESVPAIRNPALSVVKSATSSGPYDAVGDVITYSITVRNTGNETLTGVSVTDPGVGAVLGTCTPAIPAMLLPGDSQVCTATHTVTQADVDAGSYTNVALADSNQTDPASDEETVQITQNPSLSVSKTVTSTGPYTAVGDLITYAITLTNTGNQTLTGVTVSDVGAGAVLFRVGRVVGACTPPIPATLAPGASVVCLASHTVTQADIDAGHYTNVAIGDSDQTPPGSGTATVPIEQDPDLDVVKTVTSTGPYESLGQLVTYAITATNTGNQTLTGVTVTDAAAVLGGCTPTVPATLAPGASVMCTASHALTQDDLDAGTFTNTAVADSDQTPSRSAAATVPVVPDPSLGIVKIVTSTGPYDSVGDVITYSITLTNTGAETLTGVLVTDPGVDAVLGSCARPTPATLAPGASLTCAATHTVTQADIDAGSYKNIAIGDSNQTDPANATATVAIAQHPALKIAKTAVSTGPYDTVGDLITYVITAANTGNQTLTGVTITDAGAGAVLGQCTRPIPATLAPGELVNCSATHRVTQADLDAGSYSNTAVGDSNETPPGSDTETVPTVAPPGPIPPVTPSNPAIAITKSPGEQSIRSGTTAAWTITVSNTGNVPLTNVSVADAEASGCARTPATLPALALIAPGGNVSYTCVRDGVTASFTNVAVVTGDPPTGSSVSASASAHVTVTPAPPKPAPPKPAPPKPAKHPSVRLDKNPTSQTVSFGGTATFRLTVTNDGDVELTNIRVRDPHTPDCNREFRTLAVGKSESYTCTQPNVRRAFVNTATVVSAVSGTTGTVRDAARAPVRVAAALAPPARPVIRIVKSPSSQTIHRRGTARFRITVTNAGNVALRGVKVTDPLSPACNRELGSMSAGKSRTYSCVRRNVRTTFVNRAAVVATTATGRRVTDSDTAIVMTKKPKPQYTG
jgi:uncharacterized repeat protein (TIGR01451 family)